MLNSPDPLVGLAMAIHSSPGRFALLVGSGISYSAGIPTGWAAVSDIASQVAAAAEVTPPPEDPVAWYAKTYGSAPDYSGLLEAVAPTAAQRRDLLSGYFEPTDEEREAGIKVPTEAHRAIAKLVRRGTVRVIITTNFDRLLEQAIQAEGIEPTVVASGAAAAGTTPLAHTGVTVIKVHGDYLDPNIRNTVGELDGYEPSLDELLDRAFDDYGLIVCGWSATWDPALGKAIERCPTRRYGTYWAVHGSPSEEAARLIADREAVTIAIKDADSFFTGLLGKVEALDALGTRASNELPVLVAEAKRYLPDPVHRIRLHDLAIECADRAAAEIDFDGDPPSNTYDLLNEKVDRIESTSAGCVAVAGVLGQFAETPDHIDLLCRMLKRLHGLAAAQMGGLTAWINLRDYPTLLALYGAGLAAVESENWPVLGALLTLPGNAEASAGSTVTPEPLIVESATWVVLDHNATNHRFTPERRKTPVSDHLHAYMASVLVDTLRLSSTDFERRFDEWEFLLGVAIASSYGHAPLGRFSWKSDYVYGARLPDRALLRATPVLEAAGLTNLTEGREKYEAQIGRTPRF